MKPEWLGRLSSTWKPTIGIVLLLTLSLRLTRSSIERPERAIVLVAAGIWHLGDVIRVFLYPVFYLAK